MSRRLIIRLLGASGLAALLLCPVGCELFPGTPSGDLLPSFDVLLQIDNQSGFPVTVVVAFELTGEPTRNTRRSLSATGSGAAQEILWTQADRITATATVASDNPAAATVRVGDVLATRVFVLDQDYRAGDTIEFVVPAPDPGPDPFPDCNQNGVSDALDLLAGTSADCNGNSVPDECDIADGTAADTDGNGVPDDCEPGACCSADGSCSERIESACASQGGVFQGPGSTCAGVTCPLPAAACCFDDGACQDLPAADCLAANGAPQGAGTACATMSCQTSAPQACCFPAGDCSDLTPGECQFWGGQPQGPGSTCQSTSCPPPTVACCFPDATCQDLTPAVCVSLGGDSQGVGTGCANSVCPLLTQACCFPGSSCSDLVPDDCSYWGGEPQGPGTTCATTPCPPTEACCLPDGTCEDLENYQCWIQDGEPQGYGTTCWSTTCPSRRLYVDASAGGEDDGTSWADAYLSLQSALSEASDPANHVAEIWVAAGVYKPSARLDPYDPRSATFVPPAAVRIYGGFDGWESDLQERDVLAPGNATFLSGDIGRPQRSSDNCYHVVSADLNEWAGRLDGFIIMHGRADKDGAPGPYGTCGGGLYVAGGSPKIVNCRFVNNRAADSGGGFYLDGTSLTGLPAWVVNCQFVNNEAWAAGDPTGGGGGAYLTGNGPSPFVPVILTNCVFNGNFTFGQGGGLFADAISLFPLTMVNCTFVWNSACEPEGQGATLLMLSVVANSILWNNGSYKCESSQLDAFTGAIFVAHSCIEGWSGDLDPDGPGNISDYPLFVDADGADNLPGNEDDDLRLGYLSPCVDAGNNLLVPPDLIDLDMDGIFLEPLPLDINLEPRFLEPPDAIIDMGAYEQQGF